MCETVEHGQVGRMGTYQAQNSDAQVEVSALDTAAAAAEALANSILRNIAGKVICDDELCATQPEVTTGFTLAVVISPAKVRRSDISFICFVSRHEEGSTREGTCGRESADSGATVKEQ